MNSTQNKEKRVSKGEAKGFLYPVTNWWRAFVAAGHQYNRRLWGFYRHYLSVIKDNWNRLSEFNRTARGRVWVRNLAFWPLMGLAAFMLYSGIVPQWELWTNEPPLNTGSPQTSNSDLVTPTRSEVETPTYDELYPAPSVNRGAAPVPQEPPAPPAQAEPPRTSSTPTDPIAAALAGLPVFDPESIVRPVSGPVTRAQGWHRIPAEDGEWRFIPGVQFESGSAEPVFAAYAGVVTEVVKTGQQQWQVVVRHKDGWSSKYDGLAEVKVQPQQLIAAGLELGRTADKPQTLVTFILRRNDQPEDPNFYIQ